jgi:predicted metal-dependent hydrolase
MVTIVTDGAGYGWKGKEGATAGHHGADDIIPRDIRFGIIDKPTRHWFAGDIVKTALADGLSIFLPEGERFFIRSLKHYAAQMDDRELADEINGYAVQEAYHTREHEDYNRAMAALGYDVKAMEKPVAAALGLTTKPVQRLAVTCAIEHLTATLSTVTLRHPEMFEGAEPHYRRLWMWHALEEIEHKAVALDVLNKATANMSGWQRYLLRVLAMNATIIPFLLIFLRNTHLYAKTDGVKPGFRFWMRFLWVVSVSPGFWRRCIPLLLRYYLPGFNPRNSDDAALVAKGREWIAREMPAAGATA